MKTTMKTMQHPSAIPQAASKMIVVGVPARGPRFWGKDPFGRFGFV
jgi:hypothetical protein